MGAGSDKTLQGGPGLLSTWWDRFRYTTVPISNNTLQHKQPRWKSWLPQGLTQDSEAGREGREWIKGAVICTWITATILTLNSIMLIVALAFAYRQSSNQGQFQMVELYTGKCALAEHSATGIHVGINVLGTILLGASSYVMQCLGAPSRSYIDRAHARSRWLNVGTFSFRNFAIMSPKRKVLWGLLLLSSTPIHMIYNSVIFSSIAELDSGNLLIPHDLSSNESLVKDAASRKSFRARVGLDPGTVQQRIFDGTFTNLTDKECWATRADEALYSTLIYVVDRKYFHNTSSLWVDGAEFASSENYYPVEPVYWSYRVWNYSTVADGHPYQFNFADDSFESLWNPNNNTNTSAALQADVMSLLSYNSQYNPTQGALREYLDTPSHWQNSSWAAATTFEFFKEGDLEDGIYPEVPVSHCLVDESRQRCQLLFSPPIAIVVIICNAIKLSCMMIAVRTRRRDLLLTTGDALASFLTRPDPVTRGQCLLSRAEVARGLRFWGSSALTPGREKEGCWVHAQSSSQSSSPAPSPTPGQSTGFLNYPLDNFLLSPSAAQTTTELHPRQLTARKRWYQAVNWPRRVIALFCYISCIAVSFALLFHGIGADTFQEAMAIGFSKYSESYLVNMNTTNILALVLLANTPQLGLSVLYFLTDGVLTCMLLDAELQRYATRRRSLRCSWPKGQQRSTYYLTLPYRYSVPLLAVSASLHWLLSQSFFFVYIRRVDITQRFIVDEARGCCYSPLAIFITIWVAVAGLFVVVGLGFRRFESGMPLAGGCSLVLSALCHPAEGDEGAAEKTVMWGEVSGDADARARNDKRGVDERNKIKDSRQQVET
ncbi:uncharacterized protein BP01DRAFT_426147 [Aspergillus saccharolyticus JOP 1030-1]|uniref:DUF6536 domain-containing protein n=1 Tax=Aspergillus saccharolyticus JOP 1030-1 TaxID=1450539 RepID=A0A318ZDP3_9EURO|nr:hypothetical protein BP01DRAFT_426147 [Aspergillus saccharolyticus JOP 1030-1]PYH41650.1 hypothetical protein BP01DRAFT_426147 [Aspergillus saccharolyticus JOP 1030-1]